VEEMKGLLSRERKGKRLQREDRTEKGRRQLTEDHSPEKERRGRERTERPRVGSMLNITQGGSIIVGEGSGGTATVREGCSDACSN